MTDDLTAAERPVMPADPVRISRGSAPAPAPAPSVAGANPAKDRRRPLSVRRPRDPRISIVVPALNEALNIREILPYLDGYHEVIVVDGHSPDSTAAVAQEALPSAKVIQQTRKGKGNALACGFAAVTGDVIVMFDIDGSADPSEIPRFVKALVNGADLAKGSRFRKGGGSDDITMFRNVGNAGLNLLASALTDVWFTDLCYGYNAFWTDRLFILDLPDINAETDEPMIWGDGFEIEALIIGRLALSGAKITEVPSFEHGRYHGETNLNTVRDGFRVLRTILDDRLYARRFRALSKRRQASNLPPPTKPGWMK
ncbi:MAG: glycosyltransferase family 2 protein [Actinomycetes bacterium]